MDKKNNWLLQTTGWQTVISEIPVSGQTHRKKTKLIHLTIGAWDVRTLMDSTESDRPQRRTALVGSELGSYKI